MVVPQARTGVGYDTLPTHDLPVQNTRRHGSGKKEAHEPWRGLGYRGTRVTPAYRHPPVEPALCHRDSPTVAGEGWGVRSRALAAVAGPGHPPDCVLARGGPPPGFTPTPR